MIAHLPVIILVLGATIVPLLVWMFAAGRHDPETDDARPERPPTARSVSGTKQAEPDGSLRSYVLLQVRPDGVVLDWRDEPSMAFPPGLSVTSVTDTTAPR